MMAYIGGGDQVFIDVEALTRDLKEKISGNLVMSPHCSIFRVPTILSRHSPEAKAYLPDAFSFGPFHHNKEKLKPTEKIKSKYLLNLISRLSNPRYNANPKDPDTILTSLTEAIHKVWKEAWGYYGGPIGMEANRFVKVLVLDGCFIVELLRKKAYEERLKDKNDPVFSMSCLLQFLYHDLILLENQIPWMVLEVLFGLTITSIDEKPLVLLAIEFFGNVFSITPPSIEPLLSNHQSKHILDLLRNSLVLPSKMKKNGTHFNDINLEHMPSAKSLEESGVKFISDDKSESILDVKFEKGKLIFPPLLIQETTETVFRNLISLEQSCPDYEPRITSYAVLLDNLINTKEDMEVLRRYGAVNIWPNVEEATKSFNNLYIDTYVKESFYRELTRDVDTYCKKTWPKHRRVLMRDYIKRPWALISIIAASVALILSFLQTLFTIMDEKEIKVHCHLH